MYGVEQFTAVLNPPQAAIVAVGATEERVVPQDGELVVRPMMTITAHLRPPRRRRRDRRRTFLQTVKAAASRNRGSRSELMPTVWYRVRDLDAARRVLPRQLGFDRDYVDADERWATPRPRRDGDRAREKASRREDGPSRTSTSTT